MMKTGPGRLTAIHPDMQAYTSVLCILQLKQTDFIHLCPSVLTSSSLFPPSTHGMTLLIIHTPLSVVLSSPRVQTND